MSTRVGSLTIDLNANTAQLELNVNRAKKSLDSLNKLDLGEARGAIMVLGEEVGVRWSDTTMLAIRAARRDWQT